MALHHRTARPMPVSLLNESLEPRSTNWRDELPVLVGELLTLREVRAEDADRLFALLTSEEAARFISTPPSSADGVRRFITWARSERVAGTHACFAIVPHGMSDPIGIIQVRQVDAAFATAEWGFAIGSAYWGGGYFVEAAQLVMEFAFSVIGVHRLEARAAVKNGRGNGALRKLGAVQEGILRRSFYRNGEYLDQVLWTILDSDRVRHTRLVSGAVH